MGNILSTLKERLWAQIIVAMVLGVGLGLSLSPTGGAIIPEETAFALAPWIALPGGLFLALIKMVVIPLVTSSIILGIATAGDPAFLRKVGARIVPYFVGTTLVATAIGIALALFIEPGNYINADFVNSVMEDAPTAVVEVAPMEEKSVPERIISLIPTNSVQSKLDQDMLAVVITALFAGIALVSISAPVGKPFVDVIYAVQEIAMKVVEWAMRLAPVAVFGLLCDITIRIGLEALTGMAVYVGCVLLGLLLLLGFYLILVSLIGGMNPVRFLQAVREAQLLAFSTSSSAAVMPLSLQTVEEKLSVGPAISKFIIPLGATVNMAGTALYQVCAAVFLTQVFGVELTLLALLGLMATTVGASIGTPSAPGVGIVILATILEGIGVPGTGIALIIGVDRILDMSRTAVNVTGDLAACVVMNRWLSDVQTEAVEPVVEGSS